MTSTCRAKNPALCRTHGFRIRAELFGGSGSVEDVFKRMKNKYLGPSRAVAVLEDLNHQSNPPRFSPETLAIAQKLFVEWQQHKDQSRSELKDTRLTTRNAFAAILNFHKRTIRDVATGGLQDDLTYAEVAAALRANQAGQPAHYSKPIAADHYDPDEDDTIRFERNPRTGIDEVYRD